MNDLFFEKMTVEYRLFTQANGHAPDQLFVSQQDRHRLGAAFFDRFKAEVAPNLDIIFSEHVPVQTLWFLRAPGLVMTMPPRF